MGDYNLSNYFGNMPLQDTYSLGFLALLGIFAFLAFLGFYVYFALAWQTIARKLKYKKSWLAWIPFANVSMILQMGGFHWAWIFTIIFPPALLVLLIIAHWRIFEKRKYPGFFALSTIIPKIGGILYFVAIGFVAWKDRAKRLQI